MTMYEKQCYILIVKECYLWGGRGIMPSFLVKKKFFLRYKSGEKDVVLRNVQRQWKNSRVGDIAVLLCGRNTLKKRIVKIHRGSLARILKDINYKRVFPDAKNIFEANRMAREIYPEDEEFMAFELV